MKTNSNEEDELDPELNKLIIEAIRNDVMEAMATKGKIVYDMTSDEVDQLFEKIAFDVKEKVAQYFKRITPDKLKDYFKVIDDSIEDAKQRLKGELGLKMKGG
jgi:hypothetical protein